MLNQTDNSRRPRARGATATAAALALVASLALSSPALAKPDDLAGGTVDLQLKGSKGLKLKPSALTLQISGGDLDPVTGAGTVKASGKIKARRGKNKTKVKIVSLTFGANGAVGKIAAKVGKKDIASFGTLSGGTVVRDGWGAKLTGVAAKLASKGARSLTKRLSPSTKGKASAAARKIKAGQPLGTVSVTTVPKTVEVLPGGTMSLATDPALIVKLLAHCINGLPGFGGAYPVAPATEDLLGTFTFPVTGGAVAPDLKDGKVVTAGGQNIAKNVGLPLPFACDTGPPVGTTVIQSEFEAEFNNSALAANTILPTGPFGLATVGTLDIGAGTLTLDPNTKQLTMTGVPVRFEALTALVLNSVFPNASGNPANDFAGGDLLGTLSLSATLR